MSGEIQTWLTTHKNSLEKCTICQNRIPKEVHRVGIGYNKQQIYFHFRICGKCLLALAKAVDKNPVKKWEAKLMVDAI